MRFINQDGLFNVSLASLTMIGVIFIVNSKIDEALWQPLYITLGLALISFCAIICWYYYDEITKKEAEVF